MALYFRAIPIQGVGTGTNTVAIGGAATSGGPDRTAITLSSWASRQVCAGLGMTIFVGAILS
jgi:hypothetical protein